MGHKHRFVRVSFRVCIKNVQIGEHVRVCGSDDVLGNWDPEHGLSLWAFEETDCWLSEEVQLPLKELVTYKYAVCENGTGKIRYWENLDENREVVPTGILHVIEDDNGQYRTHAKEGDFPMQNVRRSSGVDKLLKLSQELQKFQGSDFHGIVYIVCVTLPFEAVKMEDGSYHAVEAYNQCGSTIALLHQGRKERHEENLAANRLRFVGWPHCYAESDADRRSIEKCLLEEDCIPVFLDESVFEMFSRFCKQYMWPVCHNVSVFSPQSQAARGSKVDGFPQADWGAYKKANGLYAAAVVQKCSTGDVIFAQDYHLLLTPKYTNSTRPAGVKAGLYLHTPWPGSSIFLSLPVRDEMLKGVLAADHVCFQFFEYTRNFLTACQRMLNLEPVFRMGGVMALEYNNRLVTLRSQHVAIPYADVLKVTQSPEVKHQADELRALIGAKLIFASMDRCERFAGIGLKLQAFRQLLVTYPQHLNRCVLLQYCWPPRSAFEDNLALQEELMVEVEQINAEFGFHVMFRIHDFDNAERFSLLATADVLLNTSIKEGLNVVPFEFLATHEGDKQGVVIVSEFAGCSRALTGALRINPWSISGVCTALDTALTMQPSERKERFLTDHSYVANQSLSHWLEDIAVDIRASRCSEGREEYLPVPRGYAEEYSLVEWHFCSLLDTDGMLTRFRTSKNRVMFFDHDGTLVAKTHGSGQSPPSKVLTTLSTLCKDVNTNVVVVSGRGRDVLQKWYGKIEGLWLCAEHGYYMAKMPLSNGWECIIDESHKSNEDWKRIATALMEHYVKRTQGSIIEHKGSCVTWNYYGSELALGNQQAKHLAESLSSLLHSYQCEVASGNGYVEVKMRGVNKAVGVNKLLARFGEPDFVLCVGDDRSDEEMFTTIHQRFDSLAKRLSIPKKRLSEGMRSLHRGWATPDPSPRRSQTSDSVASASSFPLSPQSSVSRPQNDRKLPTSAVSPSFSSLTMENVLRAESTETPGKQTLSVGTNALAGFGSSIPSMRGIRDAGPYVCTVIVGLKPTSARNYVNDVTSVQNLILLLDKGVARGVSRIASVPAMSNLAGVVSTISS